MTAQLPGNSNASKAKPEKNLKPVVSTGGVTRRSTPVFKRLGRSFLAEDAGDVKEFVFWEVVVPSAKSLISEVVGTTVDKFLFGSSGRRPSRTSYSSSGSTYRVSGGGGYSSYSKAFKRDDFAPGDTRDISRRARASHDFGEIVISSRDEAYDVLDKLKDVIEIYEVATVGDLYSLVGITIDAVDENWGWHNLDRATVVRDRQGFYLDLPKPENLR